MIATFLQMLSLHDVISADFVRGRYGRHLVDKQKTSSEKIGQNEHAHSVQSPRTRF